MKPPRNGGEAAPYRESYVVKRMQWDTIWPDDGRTVSSGKLPVGETTHVLVHVVPAKGYFSHPDFNARLPDDAPVLEWG